MDASEQVHMAEAKRSAADWIDSMIVEWKAQAELLRAEADALEAKEAIA